MVVKEINSVFEVLPDELLVHIALYLETEDCLNLKVACRRWLDTISRDRYFRKYRKIHFDECILSHATAPANIFKNSLSCYTTLEIGRIKLFNHGLEEFWKSLSGSVTELNLAKFELTNGTEVQNFIPVLNEFTEVKRLSINLKNLVFGFQNYFNRKGELFYMPSVTELYVYELNGDARILQMFLNAFPNLESIYIKSVSSIIQKELIEILKMNASKIKELGLRITFSSYSEGVGNERSWVEDEMTASVLPLSRVIQFRNLQLSALNIIVNQNSASHDTQILFDYLDQQRNLIELEVHAFFREAAFDLHPKITKLVLGLSNQIESFIFLQPLANLKHLEFCSQYESGYGSRCFFGHTILQGLTLDSLVVQISPMKSCLKCWECMFKSFPNLSLLGLHQYGYDPHVMNLILVFESQLKELRLFDLHYNGSFLEIWKPMPQLQTLDLWYATQVSVKGISHFCQMCPNLKSLRIHGQHQGYADVIVKVITTDLPCLEILELDFHTSGVTKQAFNYIEWNLRRLKVLGLGDNEMSQLTEARKAKLFQQMPKLKLIREIGSESQFKSRMDFEQMAIFTQQ